jgi:hypothetical protein
MDALERAGTDVLWMRLRPVLGQPSRAAQRPWPLAEAAVEELTPNRAATAMRGVLEQMLGEPRAKEPKGGPVEVC